MAEFLQIAVFVAFNGIIVLFAISAVLQNRENHLKRSAESIRSAGSGQTMSPAGDRSPARRARTERTRERVR